MGRRTAHWNVPPCSTHHTSSSKTAPAVQPRYQHFSATSAHWTRRPVAVLWAVRLEWT